MSDGAPASPPGAPTPPPAVAALTDGEWHRLHPATPVLKGGIALVVLLGIVVNNARDWAIELFLPGGRRGGSDEGDPFGYVVDQGWIGFVLLGIVVVIAALVGLFYLSWRMNTFRVTEEIVEVRSGVVFRTNRRARLDRIQGINIQRPLLARVFGAARLEVNQAGDDANVVLAYLRGAAADDLRREILRRASGARRPETTSALAGDDPANRGGAAPVLDGAPGTPPVAHRTGLGGVVEQRAHEFLAPELDPREADPDSVVRIEPGRLIGSVLLSGYTLFIVAAAIAVAISVAVTGEYFLLFAMLPALLGSGGFFVNRISKSLRFSIASTRDGIRIGYGLFSTTNETLPPGRIHSVKVSQPLLWRPFGWWEISINRASRSSANGADGQNNTSILPVGDMADVRRVLEFVLPELVGVAAADADTEEALVAPTEPFTEEALVASTDRVAADQIASDPVGAARGFRENAGEHAARTVSIIEQGLTAKGDDGGFTVSPRRAAVLRWFSWRRNGFRSAPGAVLLRTGAVWRRLVVVPLPRMQSVALRQGPLLRRLRLAEVTVHTVQGPITAQIGALDENDALEFFHAAGRDAVGAARADRTHRWLSAAVSGESAEGAAPARTDAAAPAGTPDEAAAGPVTDGAGERP
ncbi:PH domain-containing protein [Frigoribacterium sp. CFBP9039]|uniref:PH domain-containing protein n=1 Tax=Frigoribacterium sp. CFBP9029 TaxID=3096541 RepID=UPI002A6ACDCE|nr:PH domain-containing protein [Frigoribacterium sp. CFBP9039]MDY0945883.1 PH domain-containing protein [Frigoribacterium sp. CFBP9039]